MEQDCIADLYQTLGMSVGAEFSIEDVSLIYGKVFHVPSNMDEACVAMKKIAGADNSWSCVGENVLDVLLEMEREREKKERLYWDLQLLNVGNLNPLYTMDTPVNINLEVLNCLHQNTDPNTFKKAHNSNLGSSQSCTFDRDSSQRERKKEQHWSVRDVKRLKKAARQCWTRLVTEDVQSILASPWQGQIPGVRALNVWETLLPWQRHKEEEGLEDLAEEALESGDMLRLAELPGAFRIYRACPESREQCWSAISLLYKLYTSHQQERDTLTVLYERLDRESLRLMCLHIRLATLRAQREKMSYSAFLAAQQSWETWPHVNSPCRAEQAILWLQGEEEEQMKYFISVSPQQAVLQLLVLIQEQERQHLVQLLHGVSLEDLQWPPCTVPPKEECSQKQVCLRDICIKRLSEIHASLQSHGETQIVLEQTYPQLQPQPQMQAQIGSTLTKWSQHKLEDCALLLLNHFLELQDIQASALLPALMDKSIQHLQALQEEYESELQAKHYAYLLQLLNSDAPITSGSILIPNTNMTQSSIKVQTTDESSCSGPVEAQNTSPEPHGNVRVVSVRRASKELNVQSEDGTNTQDVCTGCGAAMEDLPYLEILCVSDATRNTHEDFAAETGAQDEEECSATKTPQSYEKQGSLITLAWCKPPENDTDLEAVAADRDTAQSQDGESSLQTRGIHSTAEHTQCEESAENHNEELKATLFQSGSTGHPDTQSADQQCSVVEQLTLEGRPILTLQVVQPHLLVDSLDVQQHANQLCSGTSNDMSNGDREVVDVEMCPTATESQLWSLSGPEPAHPEDQIYTSQASVDCSLTEKKAIRECTLMERERATEPVSAMERERTMRNLVDMQRKVEQRQQRDRERQLLRVQERLSIIQNRKAEEDLLGLKHTDRLRHLTHDLPQEDKNQQKTVVKERLEQLRRERSYVMQSKRDRNTAGFKELLGPVTLRIRETEDDKD
ncbi:hypothetical protein PAMP_019664 [Pampus punctatissimus]